MKKNKASSPAINTVILIATFIVLASIIVWATGKIWEQYGGSPEVNGEEIIQKTYHLGDLIYTLNADHSFFFHGITEGNRLVIGHYAWLGHASSGAGMTNMYVLVSGGSTFRLADKQFTVIEYRGGSGWITLEG